MTDSQSGLPDKGHRYWEMESRHGYDIDAPELGQKCLHVCLSTERPMLDGEPIERKGNRCYPSFVQITAEGETFDLLPEAARDFASQILAMAGIATQMDKDEFANDY